MRSIQFSILFVLSVLSVSAQTLQWKTYTPNKSVFNCIVKDDMLYAITYNGLFKYEINTGNYFSYDKKNTSIPFNSYSKLTMDSLGNIYFFTHNSLVRYDGQDFIEYEFSEHPYLYAHDMTVDDSNNVLIASYWGLIKFNGLEFKILTPENSIQYSHDFESIAISESGDVWLSTNQILYKYNETGWTIFKLWELLPESFYPMCLYLDNSNVLWVGGLNGYCIYDGSTWNYFNTSNTGLIQEDVEFITSDGDGNMWFGTRQGVSVFDGNIWKSYDRFNSGLPNLCITSISSTSAGDLFISTENGLVKFKNEIWQQINLSPYNFSYQEIHEVAVEEGGKLWIANGLNTGQQVGFSIYRDSLLSYENDNFYAKNLDGTYWWITDICIDRNNTKWIGTSGGLYKVTEDSVTSYFPWNSGLSSYYILSIDSDDFGNIWIGGLGGLDKLKDTTWVKYDTLNSDLPSNFVYQVEIDEHQNVWVGTEEGLAKFNGKTWKIFSTQNSNIRENFIHHFSIDKKNEIWLSNSYGIHRFDGTSWHTYNESNSPLPNNFVNVIRTDEYNNKWLGVYQGGLVRIDSVGEWTVYNGYNSELLHNNVMSLFIDNNNNKWIGTSTGLNVFNENGINTTYVIKPKEGPYYFDLMQNYPNPFNNSTKIEFTIAYEERVIIKIYDILGEEIQTLVNEIKPYGKYSVEFNAANLPSGVYIYRMQIGSYFQSKKALLLK